MNITLIVNKHSGKGRGSLILPAVTERLLSKGHTLSLYETINRKQTIEKVKSIANECDLLICMGGDGTLNEVVNGYIQAESQTPLGYIPTGSTNDFASNYKFNSKPVDAVDRILNMNTHRVDIGDFSSSYFCYVAATGAFSEVSYQTSQKMKNLLGHLAYILEGIKSVANIKALQLEVDVDGELYSGSFLICTVSNSNTVGGIFHFSDGLVSFNDGLFEIVLVSEPKKNGDYMVLFSDLVSGNFNSPFIKVINGKQATIRSQTPIPWSLDGEFGGKTTEATVSNLHKKLNLII